MNYTAGRTIANNATIPVGTSTGLTVHSAQASGTSHVVVDVVAYYEVASGSPLPWHRAAARSLSHGRCK
jgi:hypothetical protein